MTFQALLKEAPKIFHSATFGGSYEAMASPHGGDPAPPSTTNRFLRARGLWADGQIYLSPSTHNADPTYNGEPWLLFAAYDLVDPTLVGREQFTLSYVQNQGEYFADSVFGDNIVRAFNNGQRILLGQGDGNAPNPGYTAKNRVATVIINDTSRSASLTIQQQEYSNGLVVTAPTTGTQTAMVGLISVRANNANGLLYATSDGYTASGLAQPAQTTLAAVGTGGLALTTIGAHDTVIAVNQTEMLRAIGDGSAIKLSAPLKSVAGLESTGSGTALLGANCPAVTVSAPYKWEKILTSDGSTCYFPVWK